MTQEEKISMIADAIEADSLTPDTELEGLDMWDSLARLSVVIMFDKNFKKNISAEKFLSFKTVKDIMDEME
jgi:acyl carrier protein